MSKVHWEEAKIWYMKDPRVSYSLLAEYYGVTKPTIQAHASKHGWVELRKEYSKNRVAELLASAGDSYSEFESRQIKYFKHLQAIAMLQITDLNELRAVGGIKPQHAAQAYASIARTLKMAMQQERHVLGIEYKPVRHPRDTDSQPQRPNEADTEPLDIDGIINDLEKKLRYFKRQKEMIENSQKKRIEKSE